MLHLCGRGTIPAPVLFVAPCVTMAEVDTTHCPQPMMLRGGAGNLFLRCLSRAGFKDEDWFYTCLVRFLPANGKPKVADYRWATPAFLDEVERMKSQLRIVVCLGKPVLDFLLSLNPDPKSSKVKYKLSDVLGSLIPARWLGPNIRLYVMDATSVPLTRPEYFERFMTDLAAVKAELDILRGHSTLQVERCYETIKNAAQLSGLMMRLKTKRVKLLAVDCEWHGQTAWGGRLRSFQCCWAPGRSAYLRLMDDQFNYAFDVPIETVRQILAPILNDPEMKFIGHNAAADMPWMREHLGIDVYRKFTFDTLFAQHTINEYADLKLERLAVRYTDLGRYDLPLVMWKKAAKFDDTVEKGYGGVPDEILIEYGCRDVDATFRCYAPLLKLLEKQNLVEYYNSFVLPFTTDGFDELSGTGLPINLDYLNEMRRVYARNRRVLTQQFRRMLIARADMALARLLCHRDPVRGVQIFQEIQALLKQAVDASGRFDRHHPIVLQARERGRAGAKLKEWEEFSSLFEHRLDAPAFNVNSVQQRKRWLFEVLKLTPIKTTKLKGIQLPWSRVLELPMGERANYRPATDTKSIQVFAAKHPAVAQYQELRAVDTVVKNFLRGTELEEADAVPNPDKPGATEEEGEVVASEEQGLHKWVQPDGRIHANFSLTETARPRAWKPNVLNWPKAITKPIEAGFQRVQAADPEHQDKPSSLRACVQAPAGWCIIDMDLKTAEVVALAYQSGDEDMIKVLTEPDVQFARIDKDNPKKVVRIAFNENSNYPDCEKNPTLLVNKDDPRILRREDGSIIHPKRDVHWELGEAIARRPRERCDERLHRDGCGKTGNFSIPYGASPTLLERLIESNTGVKPPDGIGQEMINTWNRCYPQACEFLEAMEGIVENPGHWRSLSGRVRHFFLGDTERYSRNRSHAKGDGSSHLRRQARNFPEQELVAATTGRALLRFIDERRRLGLRSRVALLLYDAVTVLAPLEEARQTADLLRNCLTVWNQWDSPGGRFYFEVDTTFSFRWGVKMTDEERALLDRHLGKT